MIAEKLRVGILGAGWAGTSHAIAYAQLPNVAVTALWSRTRASAEALAGRLQQPALQVYDLSNGVLGDFFITPTAGLDDWRLTLLGDEGSLLITNAGQTITRQCAADALPVVLAIPEAEQAPAGVDLLQQAWNRLIADFVQAIRCGDGAHRRVPHLPTLMDGLRIEAIIAAARQSAKDEGWVAIA